MESIHELLANDLVNASVPICWETHITAFNSSGETDISGGVAGDMCSGEQKIRGNTYLRYTAPGTNTGARAKILLINIHLFIKIAR